jgi:hypothetical protein
MTSLSFAVTYTNAGGDPPIRRSRHEKCFTTMNEALNFCVGLSYLSAGVISVTQFIRGVEDAILEGQPLHTEIARRRSARPAP